MVRLAPVLVLVVLALATSCERGLAPAPVMPKDAQALARPTKDDVALVNGQRFSLSAYHWIRSLLTKDRSQGAVLWIGTAALALATENATGDDGLPTRESVEVALYAAGELPYSTAERSLRASLPGGAGQPQPEAVRAKLDALLSRAIVQKNAQVLAELR